MTEKVEYRKGVEHSFFNEVLQKFLDTIKPYLLKEGTLICAISRKAPRLLEYFITHGCIAETEIKATIVSEISFPFIRWNDFSRVVLIDDAIYYGSTFSQVYGQIKSYAANIEIIPITCIKASESYTLPFEKEIKTTRVNRGKGHYFVNTLTDCFYKMVAPFEVEFPRVTVALKDTDIESASQALEKCLDKHYHDKYYRIDYRDDVFTNASSIEGYDEIKRYAVFFEDKRDSEVTIEKIRFFVNDEKMVIMPLRSFVLSENDIDTILNKNNRIKTIWERISLEFNESKQKEHLDLYSKAKCVFINYMASLLLLKENKSAISEVIDIQSMSISSKDLSLLFGAECAMDIETEINGFLNKNEPTGSNHIEIGRIGVSKVEEIIPEDAMHANLYKQLRSKYISRCESVNEALSTLFFLQNAILDKLNRTKYLLVKRLKYGLTLSGIKKIMGSNYKKTSETALDYEINRWVDAYIERGSIVPQYIRFQDEEEGAANWVRVFRSGENEVAMISHLARFYLKIYTILKERTNIIRFENKSFRNIVAIVTLRFKQLLPNGHFDANEAFSYSFDIRRDLCCYNLILKGVNGESFDILDFLVKLDIFSKQSFDGLEYVMMNDNIIDKDLIDSTTLSPLIDEEIIDAMNTILQRLNNRINIGAIIKMANTCFGHKPVPGQKGDIFWDFTGLKKIINDRTDIIANDEVLSDLKYYKSELTYEMFDDVTDNHDDIDESRKIAIALVDFLISTIAQDHDKSKKIINYFSQQKENPQAQKLATYFSKEEGLGDSKDIRHFIENFSV